MEVGFFTLSVLKWFFDDLLFFGAKDLLFRFELKRVFFSLLIFETVFLKLINLQSFLFTESDSTDFSNKGFSISCLFSETLVLNDINLGCLALISFPGILTPLFKYQYESNP